MLNSLFYIILSFIPLYLFIIILSKIFKLNIKSLLIFFIGGIYSIGLLSLFLRVFPFWSDNFIDLYFNNNIHKFIKYLIICFIQIALIEEISKFTAFKLFEKYYGSIVTNINRRNYAILCASTALGFSFIENIDYAYDYGHMIILYRSITASIAHFLCGYVMGYFLYGHKKNIKRLTLGIFSSTFLHGLYDFVLIYYLL